MRIVRLKLNQFRNLAELDLCPSPHFNFIYGPNGSGKSSLLEAIYFLGFGRSFRSALASRAIHYDANQFGLFSIVLGNSSITLGLEKTRQSKLRIKLGNGGNTIGELAQLLPVQLVSPNSYYLLSGGPRRRRRFIDWGVFHVEPQFFTVWGQFQRVLKQRNAALQKRMHAEQLCIWNLKLIELSQEITRMRVKYLQQLKPLALDLIRELINLEGLTIEFYQGWGHENALADVLARSFQRDIALGYTQYGPQKADLRLKIRENPVHEVLSRGEQKLLAYALQLAQGLLLKKLTDKSCIYLLDDLFAELDSTRQSRLVALLNHLESQVFITVIEDELIEKLTNDINGKTFRVEAGQVFEIQSCFT